MKYRTWMLLSAVSVMCLSEVYGQGLQIARDFGQQALHVHHINKQAQKYLKQANGAAQTLFQETVYNDVAARAEETLARNRSYDVSPVCLNQTEKILQAILDGENWALRFVDAMGKPPSGLLDFNLAWFGSYDECLAGEAQDQTFKGKYCRAFLSLGGQSQTLLQPGGAALSIGLCVPDTCSAADAAALSNTLLSLIPLNTSALPPFYAICDEELEYDGKAIFVIVIISLFLVVMVTATTFDLYITFWVNQTDPEDSHKKEFKYGGLSNGHVAETERTPLLPEVDTYNRNSSVADYKIEGSKSQQDIYEPGILGKLLLSFSVYTNCRKILSTSQPSGTLTAVNGIRFISMTWVILGHTYAFGLSVVENISTYLPRMLKRFTFQAIGNATVAVDTFFVLSGLLVAYLSLKEMRKRGGAKKFSWGMFYFHRFWRLTPPYMLFLMLYVPTAKYWTRGPMWPQQQGFEIDECSDSWWRNLLYINNIYEPQKSCMAWSWYLANDMQFYIISPLMLVPLYYSPLWGSVSCFALVLLGSITTGAISKHYGIGANMLVGNDGGDSFNEIYVKPWCRVGPYAVGFFTGYLLYYTDCKFRMSKIINMAGWAISTGVAILVLYGLYTPDGGSKLGEDTSALYNATFRVAWGMCICWVIFACATGNGGPVNTFLSWRAIIPLSRLTYCAYLVHPVIMYTYYFSRHTLMYWQDIELIYLFLAHTCLAYAGALVISLGFESPMMGLEKVLLGRAKRS